MRSSRRRRAVKVAGAVFAVVAMTALVAGGRRTPNASGTADFAQIHSGPQGMVGQFVVKCGYSHTALDDPIVHPGKPGLSHSHDFFGSRSTNAGSTTASLVDGATTCNMRRDTAAYWAPTLYDRGVPVVPLGMVAYYRPAPGVDPATLHPYPQGLMMIAGDSMATGPQPVEVAAWTCGSSSDLRTSPPECPPDAPLRNHLTFADCWDGVNLDSADHRSHLAPSHAGRCPASHPVPLPQLTLTVRYPVSGAGHDLTLASGSTDTVHGDFLNAWDEAELTSQVDLCLHRNVVCSVASNRAEDVAQGS